MKMSEATIQERLRAYAAEHRYLIGNAFIFDWESDFFSVNKKYHVVEYEIKISKADFKKDVEKRKHYFFENCNKGIFIERGKTVGHNKEYCHTDAGNNEYHEKGKFINAAFSNVTWHDSNKFIIPNYFYYACPAGLLSIYDIPSYAGLLHVHVGKVMTIKKAPLLHSRKIVRENPIFIRGLLEKFYWMSYDQQRKLDEHGIKFKARTNIYVK